MSPDFHLPGRGEQGFDPEGLDSAVPALLGFNGLENGFLPEPRSPEVAMIKDSFVLTSEAGLPIAGDVWIGSGGRNLPTVVLCHGFQGFKDWAFFPFLAESFVLGGFAVVTFSTSHCGVSAGSERFDRLDLLEQGTISTDLADLGVVLAAVFEGTLPGGRMFDLAKVSLLGHSRGGAIALLMARRNPRIGSLVTWGAPARLLRAEPKVLERWRREGVLTVLSAWTGQPIRIGTQFLDDLDRNKYDLLDALSTLPIPYLILHGKNDEIVPPTEAEELYEAGPVDGVEALWIPGADHAFGAGQPFAGSNAALDQAIALSKEFLLDTTY